jgi:hypothetical protein
MRQIIGAFGTLLILVFHVLICISVSVAAEQAEAAKAYKADVIAEIENSNFNPNVIAACIRQAETAGYQLKINECMYDEEHDIQTAEVILGYICEMPLFHITETKETRGFAH